MRSALRRVFGLSTLIVTLSQVPAVAQAPQFLLDERHPWLDIGKCRGLTYALKPSDLPPYQTGIIFLKRYRIALHDYDTYLPIMVIREQAEFDSVISRTANVAERLGVAFDILRNGGHLKRGNIAGMTVLSVEHPDFAHDFRILTIHNRDPIPKPGGLVTKNEAAEYLGYLLEAYIELFVNYRLELDNPVVQTVDGAVLEAIYNNAQMHRQNLGDPELTETHIQRGIDLLPEADRQRLYDLALLIPRDWEAVLQH
jgi:hypothetical protein